MEKKIMILASSPREKGNTNTVVSWVAQAAAGAGAQVDIVDTAHLNYKTNGCIACMGCQKSDKYECVIADDAQPIIASVPKYDLLVLATPIYYMGFNAQLKLFVDRMFSLFKFSLETGQINSAFKKPQDVALIATAGGGLEDSGLLLTEQNCRAIADFGGGKFQSLLVPSAPHQPGQIGTDDQLRQKAIAFGERIAC